MGKVKIVLIGEEAVGKTTLRKKFMGEKFPVSYLATIGADFAKKDIRLILEGKEYLIEVLIWDLAGQDSYKLIRESFYEGSAGALLVVDITRRDTFNAAEKWIDELWKNSGSEPVPFVILANKADLRKTNPEKTIGPEETMGLVEEVRSHARKQANFKYSFLETSGASGVNVDKAFETLVREILVLANSKDVKKV